MGSPALGHVAEFSFGDSNGFELTVARRGAALTGARYRGQSVMPRIDPVDHPLSAGDLLLPWPNRIRDGRWSTGGVGGTAPINEPARNNAIHGLVRALEFVPVQLEAHRGVLRTRLEAGESYPFTLEIELEFSLNGPELRVDTGITNLSAERAPWAFGVHPYLGIAGLGADELELQVNASEVLLTDERMLPIGREAVSGRTDLRTPRPLAHLNLDHAFVGRGTGAIAILAARDGRSLEVHGDESIRYLQVFTPLERGTALGDGAWVAIEPMTAPADALNSGEAVRWLPPGETASVSWSLRATGTW